MHRVLLVWIRRTAAAIVVLCAAGAQPASATPVAGLEYLLTDAGGGLFRYDFTLRNQGDPLADAGYDAYDLGLFFSPTATLVSSALPVGWDLIAGIDFVDAFSLLPGASPFGSDIAAGALANFSFVFDNQLSNLAFQVLFSNPLDPINPVTFNGVATAVPEPMSLLLIGTGLGSIVVARRIRRRR
jgi:hypothetical protein